VQIFISLIFIDQGRSNFKGNADRVICFVSAAQ
jgi:hypothetical protein